MMKNVNVLLVEDNEVNQILAGLCLRKWGMGVTIANHGKEALSLIQSRSFQVVLMDLQMPEMDGYESTTRIRAMEDVYFKTVPIIAFSASSMIDSKEKAMEHGMTDFVHKPLLAEELQHKINTYVVNTTAEPCTKKVYFEIEKYAEGDAEFKQELITLMIENIKELIDALHTSVEKNDADIFQKICHKVSPTLGILNDTEFNAQIEQLKNGKSPYEVANFEITCQNIVHTLKQEL